LEDRCDCGSSAGFLVAGSADGGLPGLLAFGGGLLLEVGGEPYGVAVRGRVLAVGTEGVGLGLGGGSDALLYLGGGQVGGVGLVGGERGLVAG